MSENGQAQAVDPGKQAVFYAISLAESVVIPYVKDLLIQRYGPSWAETVRSSLFHEKHLGLAEAINIFTEKQLGDREQIYYAHRVRHARNIFSHEPEIHLEVAYSFLIDMQVFVGSLGFSTEAKSLDSIKSRVLKLLDQAKEAHSEESQGELGESPTSPSEPTIGSATEVRNRSFSREFSGDPRQGYEALNAKPSGGYATTPPSVGSPTGPKTYKLSSGDVHIPLPVERIQSTKTLLVPLSTLCWLTAGLTIVLAVPAKTFHFVAIALALMLGYLAISLGRLGWQAVIVLAASFCISTFFLSKVLPTIRGSGSGIPSVVQSTNSQDPALTRAGLAAQLPVQGSATSLMASTNEGVFSMDMSVDRARLLSGLNIENRLSTPGSGDHWFSATYSLEDQYARFEGTFGVPDAYPVHSYSACRVKVNGKTVFARTLKGVRQAFACQITLRHKQTLTIMLNDCSLVNASLIPLPESETPLNNLAEAAQTPALNTSSASPQPMTSTTHYPANHVVIKQRSEHQSNQNDIHVVAKPDSSRANSNDIHTSPDSDSASDSPPLHSDGG